MLWALLFQFPEVKLLEVRELSIKYQNYWAGNRMPELDGRPAKDQLSLEMNVNVLRIGEAALFWDNVVHGTEDVGQFRGVGWLINYGIRWRFLEVGREHHSQHILDAADGVYGFPVNDSYYFKLYLIR